jgi:hypothetical protein
MGELAEEGSFRDLTVDGIARRAGLSRSAFYFYFPDKQDLTRRPTAGGTATVTPRRWSAAHWPE